VSGAGIAGEGQGEVSGYATGQCENNEGAAMGTVREQLTTEGNSVRFGSSQSFVLNRQTGIVLFRILCFFFVPYGNGNTLSTHEKWARDTRLW
jgi:hypothetical protein